MKKRLLSLMMVGVVTLGLGSTAFAEEASDNGDLTFCTILANNTDYCKAEQAGAEALAEELGINHIALNANGNAQTEVDCIQSAISQGVDAMFIHDIDITALGPAVQSALDAGIQVSCASTIREYLDEDYINQRLKEGNIIDRRIYESNKQFEVLDKLLK